MTDVNKQLTTAKARFVFGGGARNKQKPGAEERAMQPADTNVPSLLQKARIVCWEESYQR